MIFSNITCALCHHSCRLAPGEIGICQARSNVDGKMVNRFAGRLSSLALDPIEKKPLSRFYPGKLILSAGGFGCNMACPFCQNCRISQIGSTSTVSSPYNYTAQELVTIADKQRSVGNIGIAFTYNEPLVNFEYILETFTLARAKELETILITNGSFRSGIIRQIAPVTTAWNIDLKCFSKEKYHELGGSLELVKSTIEIAAATAHLEITTLVVPGLSDDEAEMETMSAWLAEIDRNIPYHLSRYFPRYLMSTPAATPVEKLYKLKKIAKQYLTTVLLGNV